MQPTPETPGSEQGRRPGCFERQETRQNIFPLSYLSTTLPILFKLQKQNRQADQVQTGGNNEDARHTNVAQTGNIQRPTCFVETICTSDYAVIGSPSPPTKLGGRGGGRGS